MEEKTINIMDLLLIALRHIWIIILAAVIFAAGAFGYCNWLVKPSYSATASIIATNGGVTGEQSYNDKNTVSASDLSASLYLANTVVDILKTHDIYAKVANELGGDYTAGNIMGRTSVARRGEETLFIDITVSSANQDEAITTVNEIAEISCEYVTDYFPYSIVKVASKANSAPKTYPRTFMTTCIAGLVGALVAYIVMFIIESANKSIKGEEDFVNNFDVPLLGAVPDFENVESSGYRKSKGRGGYSSGY